MKGNSGEGQPGTLNAQPATDNATDDTGTTGVPRLLIVPIALAVATLMIGLPLLRALVLEPDSETTRRDAVTRVHNQVAILFSTAVLERRSNRLAERYVVDGIEPEVRDVIADLRRRDSAELEGATVTTEQVTCRQPATGGTCFRARLARPGEPHVAELRFVVAIVNGIAQVIALGDGGTALGS